jgi:hypothetical protein
MDKTALVKKLNEVFCNWNKSDAKYSEVWLTEADFGGLYNSGKFTLNVKAEHEISSCFDEINNILELLRKDAPTEEKYIYSVMVYDPSENVHCAFEDIKVFTENEACA